MLNPSELEAVVNHPTWVLGIELRTSGRTGSAFHHGATSSVSLCTLEWHR